MIFFLPSIIPALVYVSSYQNMLAVGGPQDEIWNAIFGVRFPPLLSQADTATNTITIPAADVAGTFVKLVDAEFDASIRTKTDAGILFGDTLVVEA